MKKQRSFPAAFAALSPIRRARHPLAFALAALAAVLLWNGLQLSDFMPSPGKAIAGAPGRASGQEADAPPLSAEARLLQSAVDSVALGLGSAFATLPGEEARKSALAAGLSSLTFELGGEVYFTAWQGTRMLHSPMTPDTAAMDFADALDEQGAPFVREMKSTAETGGGFVSATLPRQLPGRDAVLSAPERGRSPLRLNKDASSVAVSLEQLSSGILAPGTDGRDGAPRVVAGILTDQSPDAEIAASDSNASVLVWEAAPVDATPVRQMIYVRQLPGSDWYLAAFMPEQARPAPAGTGFSSVWVAEQGPEQAAEEAFRKGLCLSGVSLAGLAGLLLTPGRGRDDEEEGAV